MKNLKQILCLLALLSLSKYALAQTEGVSIKPSPAPPHASAMLEVESTTKGVLFPRLSIGNLSLGSPVLTPTLGLLAFNTNATTGKGFHYWDGSWIKLSTAPELWTKIGATNHIQYFGGKVNISTPTGSLSSAPVYQFEVKSDTSVLNSRFVSNGEELRWGHKDKNGESGDDPWNVLVQKNAVVTTTCTYFRGFRYAQLYEQGDYGFAITSQAKCKNGATVSTIVGTSKNHLRVSSDMGTTTIYGNTSVVIMSTGGQTTYSLGAWASPSDSTLKKDIRGEESILAKIKNLKPVTYKMKTDKSGRTNHGLLAQDLEKVFPEMVMSSKLYDRDEQDQPKDSYQVKKGIIYNDLIPVLLKAIQEQQAIIENLEDRVKTLERK